MYAYCNKIHIIQLGFVFINFINCSKINYNNKPLLCNTRKPVFI